MVPSTDAAPDAAPDPASSALKSSATVALIVDVDGVVSSVQPDADVWGDEVTAGQMLGPVRVSPQLSRALDELGNLPHVVAFWLTSWPPESRQRMDPFPGRTWPTLSTLADTDAVKEAAGPDPDRLGWWKWDAVRAWLQSNPGVRTLVWCDDHLGMSLWPEHLDGTDHPQRADETEGRPTRHWFEATPEDSEFATTVAAIIEPPLRASGVNAVLVAPETSVGLRPSDMSHIQAAVIAAAPP